jgi:hypothetical protein
VFAGHYTLQDLGLDLRGLIEQALAGSIRTPDGEIAFPPQYKGEHEIQHERFHSLGHQEHLDTVVLHGAASPACDGKALEWELRSHETPYESVQEICNEYDLGGIDGSFSRLAVLPFGVISIDATSRVDGTNASIGVRVAEGLERNKVSLGYRVFNPGNRVVRGTIPGKDLRWGKATICRSGGRNFRFPMLRWSIALLGMTDTRDSVGGLSI